MFQSVTIASNYKAKCD